MVFVCDSIFHISTHSKAGWQ